MLGREADLLAILDAGPIMPEDTALLSRRRQRQAQAGIDALIAYLDATDADPDLEDEGDIEPNCGDAGTHAGNDECELVCEDEGACIQSQPHDEVDSGDREPALGSLDGMMDQRSWAESAYNDAEPSLGSPEVHHDQRRWGQGHGSRELDHDERYVRDTSMGAYDRTERIRRDTEAMLSRKGLVPDRGHSNVVAFHPDMLPWLRRVS